MNIIPRSIAAFASLVCSTSNAAKKYFDMIETNKKEFIAFEQSAHYPQFEEKEKFYEWMCDTFIK